ncbi:hypothetical protein Ahy_A07g036838 isoform A [Arachis hypogaea]|uniref:Subtilisin inhibitor 1 n=1 Tax=Arachis hypogaea TaxID=3818 RepID=A0A445CH17_ARAHY|nr:hypothetical protein Ahy_A07g036838 isoform A [Arachis hypogaea]
MAEKDEGQGSANPPLEKPNEGLPIPGRLKRRSQSATAEQSNEKLNIHGHIVIFHRLLINTFILNLPKDISQFKSFQTLCSSRIIFFVASTISIHDFSSPLLKSKYFELSKYSTIEPQTKGFIYLYLIVLSDVCYFLKHSHCLKDNKLITVSYNQPVGSNNPKKISWPELVGTTSEKAKKKIKEEMDEADIQLILPGYSVTFDFRSQRVRIYVDESDKVIRTPSIG